MTLVDSWSDCGNAFNAENGQFHVEMMQNGYARVHDRRSGLMTLIDPDDGSVRSGIGVPPALAAEIMRRWGQR
jgi:hypothetical protein